MIVNKSSQHAHKHPAHDAHTPPRPCEAVQVSWQRLSASPRRFRRCRVALTAAVVALALVVAAHAPTSHALAAVAAQAAAALAPVVCCTFGAGSQRVAANAVHAGARVARLGAAGLPHAGLAAQQPTCAHARARTEPRTAVKEQPSASAPHPSPAGRGGVTSRLRAAAA